MLLHEELFLLAINEQKGYHLNNLGEAGDKRTLPKMKNCG
jgi:hypothetical protein